MNISVAMSSHWFVRGVRLFCGLQSKPFSSRRFSGAAIQSGARVRSRIALRPTTAPDASSVASGHAGRALAGDPDDDLAVLA
jgi:hypothetical protein